MSYIYASTKLDKWIKVEVLSKKLNASSNDFGIASVHVELFANLK